MSEKYNSFLGIEIGTEIYSVNVNAFVLFTPIIHEKCLHA